VIIDLTETINLLGGLLNFGGGGGGDGGYLGIYPDETALNAAHPPGDTEPGSTATVTSPNGNLFYLDGTGPAWVDTGTGYLGDMLKAVYDPSNVQSDAFSMGNMVETPTDKILTAAERSEIAANTASRHDEVTLNPDATTQETLNLAAQELQVNPATPATAGAMPAADKAKTNLITVTTPVNLDTAEQTTNKGQPNGYPSLDGSGLVPVSQLPSSVIGGIKVIASWDASTNTPDLNAITADQGQAYMVSVAGSTNINGETNWKPKDLVVWDDTLAGNWFKLDNTDDVLSVNGQTGPVTLNADDIGETASRVWFLPAERVNLTTLTDGSNADSLHQHSIIQNAAGTTSARAIGGVLSLFTDSIERLRVLLNGDIRFFSYGSSRNDGTAQDVPVYYPTANGTVQRGRVLPYQQSITDRQGGINNTATFLTYLQLDFTIAEAGEYPLEWFYVWSYNAANSDFQANVILDTDPPSAPIVLCEHVQEPKDTGGPGPDLPNLDPPPPTINASTNQKHPCSGFTTEVLAAGDYIMYIEIACSVAGNEAACHRGTLRVGHKTNV